MKTDPVNTDACIELQEKLTLEMLTYKKDDTLQRGEIKDMSMESTHIQDCVT